MAEVYPRTAVELENLFRTEAACRECLCQLRWPEGFCCPVCGAADAAAVRRGLWRCRGCRRDVSVLAGTVFQDSKLPLRVWFRAMWHVVSQKSGVSALGLQRALGLGSYRAAWSVLHKLRRAMVWPGRERLRGMVEVDEAYRGGEEAGGATGRMTYKKTLIAVAAERDGDGTGRVRLAHIADLNRATLHSFIAQNVEPGTTICTDGLNAYRGLGGVPTRASGSATARRWPPCAAPGAPRHLLDETLAAGDPSGRRRSRPPSGLSQ